MQSAMEEPAGTQPRGGPHHCPLPLPPYHCDGERRWRTIAPERQGVAWAPRRLDADNRADCTPLGAGPGSRIRGNRDRCGVRRLRGLRHGHASVQPKLHRHVTGWHCDRCARRLSRRCRACCTGPSLHERMGRPSVCVGSSPEPCSQRADQRRQVDGGTASTCEATRSQRAPAKLQGHREHLRDTGDTVSTCETTATL